jgi:hypothetical protein
MQILLVHGLCRSPLAFVPLARVLRRHGHTPQFFGYVAAVESWSRIVQRLHERLIQLANADDDYALIGHSLGGILIANALGQEPSLARPPAHLITLGTPVRPPKVARIGARFRAFRLLTGEAARRLPAAGIYDLFTSLPCPWTAVYGTVSSGTDREHGHDPNDGLVAASEAKPPAGAEAVEVKVLHTFLPSDRRVRATVLNVLHRRSPDGVRHC